MKHTLTILAFFAVVLTFAQEINRFDSQGKRHGIWKKYYEGTQVLRYEGEFSHGKEIGLFKFYKNVNNEAKLSATKQFNPKDDLAEVHFYTSKGKLMSKGKMQGKAFIGEWVFYHNKNDNVMTRENYNTQGKLDGQRTVYYTNGNIAEIQHYKDGKLHGKVKLYTEKNEIISAYTYQDDQLHGEAIIYDANGNISAQGIYKNNKRHGIWKFYEKGKLKEEKDFTPKSKNPYKKKP
ncbi:MAG TPA: toxin-antitoxin system YwqK family antitoxin [Flavobacteriaceae bacterium]|nr:toxin-antitoxin system YwqK family antitoxin [Flavobacteriaceae bacterium]